jgi:hypothetical protein
MGRAIAALALAAAPVLMAKKGDKTLRTLSII